MIRASVVELSSSTVEKPAYGIRLDSKFSYKIDKAEGGDQAMQSADGAAAALDKKGLGAENEIETNLKNNLSLIDVTTREAAELAVVTTGYALQELDEIRSQIGSVQNQLQATVNNITVTQVNVTAAESQIRDVDFAQESANFNKSNILAQSGVYAMSQANAVQQNVMSLLR